MLQACGACAQSAEDVLADSDLSGLYEFAEEYGVDLSLEEIGKIAGQGFSLDALLEQIRTSLRAPAAELMELGMAMLPEMLLLVLMRATMPDGHGGTPAAMFFIRLSLIGGFTGAIMKVISDALAALEAAGRLSDVLAPILSAIMVGTGLSNVAGLISPAAALAANIVENVFCKYGIPLCKFALCCALAGNLSKAMRLTPVYRLLKKAVNWGTGLVITVFTAFLSLQNSMAVSMDGVGLRTAKYAVDSAGAVIGSGISDAWDSYVSGMMIARNTIGISGIVIILTISMLPVIYASGCMLMLRLFSAVAEIMGEKETADMIEQLSGVCQMAVSLMVGGIAAITILMTATMAAGGGLFA